MALIMIVRSNSGEDRIEDKKRGQNKNKNPEKINERNKKKVSVCMAREFGTKGAMFAFCSAFCSVFANGPTSDINALGG